MILWLRGLAAAIAAHVPTTLSLAFLAAVAVLGMRNGWQVPSVASLWHPTASRGRRPSPEKLP